MTDKHHLLRDKERLFKLPNKKNIFIYKILLWNFFKETAYKKYKQVKI